ncbi:acyl transferase domain-containing protein [Lentzea atacamensis]|uniref:Acyl transferase domain-containing protein n=2 Tax=Lentzea atacamensis TaxID=531938 RepID=A0A316HEF0_9PSEU|nr:acyl transferase domain-containing protein [Lentzea atacamensis]
MAEHTEPIAVIGIGCRMPGGVTGPDSLWDLLDSGTDAVQPIPPERWDVDRYYSPEPGRSARMSARRGGFLDDVATFDAAFFGISGRVAEQMDPQQRLLLEVCWEAFEDAGIVPDSLAGSRVGVFVGAFNQDYGGMQTALGELESLGTHSATGTFLSIVSNRLSHVFDLRGPSMTIDTACSSSLVAVHLAVESIHRGESELAVAAGVSLMLTPQVAISLSQASMLSPEGVSRAFDADASGYVRGEGAGVVVLKPLSRAQFDRDRIYAVIRGSAVNQDGRTQGITVPSGEAQIANFRSALETARVLPADVGYVEAHGTGTPVGDPIEANSLGRVLSEGRDEGRQAYLGSIKTNIGHLEAGAGIAGLIKAALSIHHRKVPGNLHFVTPNPEIDFTHLTVPTATVPWPAHYSQAIASVNSFGFGGTNANVVLAERPAPEKDQIEDSAATVLTFSARSEAALGQLLAGFRDRPSTEVQVLARNLARRRSHHSHRLAVVASNASEADTALRSYLAGVASPRVVSGKSRANPGKVAFLFNGQGPQWYAMGRTLIETSPTFRAKLMECDTVARRYLDWSIYDELNAPSEHASRIHRTEVLQPTMFALQVALVEMWREWGVEPDGVVGHSMGEIAAAHVSGALDLDTALRVICRRARIQEDADSTGAMMFVALGRIDALRYCGDEVWLSAENSPKASTLSGRRAALEALEAQLREEGVFARILKVNCACHSQDMDPLRERLLDALADVTAGETTIPMYSTVTGRQIEGSALSGEYWWQNFREPVLFAPAIRSMQADGFDTFIEISPHPVLRNSLRELLDEDAVVVSSLSRDGDDWDQFLTAFAQVYVSGGHVDWEQCFPGAVTAVDLPKNPWQGQRYWNESETSLRQRAGGQSHPMLKWVDSIRPTWEIKWDDYRLTWVRDHEVFGSVIVPGAAYVEAALAAGQALLGEPVSLEFVEFERACVLDPEQPTVSRIELDQASGTFEVHNRPVRGDNWVRNVHGRFHRASPVAKQYDIAGIRERCTRVHKSAAIYGLMRQRGYAYGPSFYGIERLHVGAGEALAHIKPPQLLQGKTEDYLLHPVILDACFQSAILHPLNDRTDDLLPFTYLPTSIEAVRVHGDLSTAAWCYTKLRKLDITGLSVDVYVLDAQGRLIAEYVPMHGKMVRQNLPNDPQNLDNHLYRLAWQPTGEKTACRSALAAELRSADLELTELVERLHRNSYTEAYQTDLRRLCSAYVADCLRSFGHNLAVGDTFTLPEVQEAHRKAFAGLARFLVADGLLADRDGVFEVVQPIDLDSGLLWRRALEDHPACVWELQLLRRTGKHLHHILAGTVDPLTVLFPGGSHADTEPIYQTSPISRFHNMIMRKAVARLVTEADSRRTIRVLEVGGGTGGLTANLLPVLPAERCEYVFTDVSPAFVQAANDKFRSYPFFSAQTLDITGDMEAQGISPGSFDLVLASNVVHATADLKHTISQLREVLLPQGVLGLIEALPGNRWLDLTFGLTAGWWHFRDLQLRPDGPLLTTDHWRELLNSVGFDQVVAFPENDESGGQAVLLARRPLAEAAQTDEEPECTGDWLVRSDGSELARALVQRIEARGGRVHEDVSDVLLKGAIDFSSADGFDVVELARQRIPKLFVVTRGVHGERNDDVRLDGAAAWGVGLVANLELPETVTKLIDLDAAPDETDVDAVWAELWRDDDEREVLLRAGERFIRRLVRVTELRKPVDARQLPDGTGFRLEMSNPGALDELTWQAVRRTPPGPGQVELRITAAGLNFLDVMTALGNVPTLESGTGYRFGAECSGVITGVGPDVRDLTVGQKVIALSSAQGAIASHITLDASCVLPKPDSLAVEEAACVPIVFLTAWYALRKLARLQAGERVLIHSATGGTGLAAIQLARAIGAEVFATAGTQEKRDLLRALGVTHVMDSRSVTFAEQVRSATNGAGIDVVLSAASGETVDRSISCMAAYGRYVEIGKRDLLDDRKFGLRPFLRNLAYFGFDLRQLLVDRPEAVRVELEELLKLFDTGQLRPLPTRVFHPSQVETAFRHLSAGKHIGKIVLSMDEHELQASPLPAAPLFTGTWLITGGCGGVGLAMAESLVDAGVRSLVLLGRSGADERAEERIEQLRQRDAQVVVERVDITVRQQLADVLSRVQREMPALNGVIHSAMVLDDSLITVMNRERYDRVVAPKLLGALHLHELTEHMPLAAFVLFSSATSMIGNIGQANYAAANTFLDQLAEARHARGLPALSVNWGTFADVGYVSQREEIRQLVGATGMREFTARQAFQVLTRLCQGDQPRVGVLPMNWPQFLRARGDERRFAVMAADCAYDEQVQTAEVGDELVKERLKAKISTLLGIPFDDLDETMPLVNYLDSLLAVELKSWLERELTAQVNIIELMQGPTIAQLAERLTRT